MVIVPPALTSADRCPRRPRRTHRVPESTKPPRKGCRGVALGLAPGNTTHHATPEGSWTIAQGLDPGKRMPSNMPAPTGAQGNLVDFRISFVISGWKKQSMSQSLVCQIIHMVFSTKHRWPLIAPDLRPRLYAYIGGIVRQNRGCLLKCGGTSDHIHLLSSLHQTTSIAKTIREIKSKSTGWVHETFPRRKGFSWQTGYAAFSVGKNEVERVKRYIETQEIHHRKRTFKQELRWLLKSYGLEFDEKYLWD